MTEHWTLEWYDICAKYMHMKYGWTPTKEEFLGWSMREKYAVHVDALAMFKMHRHYFSLDDVPDKCKDGNIVWIRGDKKSTQYYWSKKHEEWMEIGSVHDELY